MRKKGFTLIELLVVIAIIAMLLAILMPALGAVKKLAQRLICGTNVKGIGVAQYTYAIDNREEFARQGAGGGFIDWRWDAVTAAWEDMDVDWRDQKGSISIGASLYLLVRDVDTEPDVFVCPSSEQKPYTGQGITDINVDLLEVWDFGHPTANRDVGPENCVSYSYQLPYKNDERFPARPADSNSSASFAFFADRNPWLDSTFDRLLFGPVVQTDPDHRATYESRVGPLTVDWGTPPPSVRSWVQKIANSGPHQREGQNVLFGDGHVDFEKRSDIGYQNDNIYRFQGGSGPVWIESKRRNGGSPSGVGKGAAKNKNDSYLVGDDEAL